MMTNDLHKLYSVERRGAEALVHSRRSDPTTYQCMPSLRERDDPQKAATNGRQWRRALRFRKWLSPSATRKKGTPSTKTRKKSIKSQLLQKLQSVLSLPTEGGLAWARSATNSWSTCQPRALAGKPPVVAKRKFNFTEGFVESLKSLLDVEGEKGALSGEKLSHICPSLQAQKKPKISLQKQKFIHWWDVIAPQVKVDVELTASDGTFKKDYFTSELHLDQYLGLAPRTMLRLAPKGRWSRDFKLEELELLDQMSRDELLSVITTSKLEIPKPPKDLSLGKREQYVLDNMSIDELMNVATTLKSRVSFLKTFKSHMECPESPGSKVDTGNENSTTSDGKPKDQLRVETEHGPTSESESGNEC